MADTFYGYAERDVDSQINWAEIGKNITKTLSDEAKLREEKKAAIDEATRQYGIKLSNKPQGKDRNANEWTLRFADNAQKSMLLLDRLLKSGQMDLKQYTINKQNLLDGTDRAFSLVTNYQDEYGKKWERANSMDPTKRSQYLESFLMSSAERFADFNNTDLYINPMDYKVNVAFKEEKEIDGKKVMIMSPNPNNFTSIDSMENWIKAEYNYFDSNAALKVGVDNLGSDIQTIRKMGSATKLGTLTEVLDITNRERFGSDAKKAISIYEEAENTYLDSLLSNPLNISSVLTNDVSINPNTKESFDYTFNPDEAKSNENLILLKNDPSGNLIPEFTEAQRKIAKDALRTKFRMMLDKEVKTDVYQEPKPEQYQPSETPEWQFEAAKGEQAASDAANMIGKFYYGDDQELKAAANYFFGKGKVKTVGRSGSGVKILYYDKDQKKTLEKTLDFYGGGKRLTQEQFIQSASPLLAENLDINSALASGNYEQGRAFNPNSKVYMTINQKKNKPKVDYSSK